MKQAIVFKLHLHLYRAIVSCVRCGSCATFDRGAASVNPHDKVNETDNVAVRL